jgi:hypothetical protein
MADRAVYFSLSFTFITSTISIKFYDYITELGLEYKILGQSVVFSRHNPDHCKQDKSVYHLGYQHQFLYSEDR